MNYNKFSKPSVALTATVVFFVCVFFMTSLNSSAASKSNTDPDFAYPKTVSKNAQVALQKAIADSDWQSAAEAAIQFVTADNLISHENAVTGLTTLDSISGIAPDIWEPAFLLIEANIYNTIYNSIRWKANSRDLPLDSVPDNPYEWSKSIFADKVYSLCNQIIDSKGNESRPLNEWNRFLTNTTDAYQAGLTVEEFLLRQSFQLLNEYADPTKDIIPFFTTSADPVTPAQKCAALRDKAINMLIDETSSLRQSLFLAKSLVSKSDILPYSQRLRFLTSALERVQGTEGEQVILMNLRDFAGNFQDEDKKSVFPYSKAEYINLIKKSLNAFPKGVYASALKNIIEDFTRPIADIEFSNQYLTSIPITMDVNLSNCNECWILVYDYAPFVNATRQPKTKVMASSCRLVKAVKVSAKGSVPFSEKVTANVGNLPVGTYVVVPSATADSKGIFPSIQNDTWRDTFSVSDISVITLKCPDATTKVFVVDGADGHPVEGATVKVYNRPNYSSDRMLSKTLTTDKNGCVTVSDEKFEIEASYNGSKWSNRMRMFNSIQKLDTVKRKKVQILADRSIYHPGDSIEAAIIAYSTQLYEMNLGKEMPVNIKLLDANGKEIAAQSSVTDRFGRTIADFKIPEQGLLGRWRLVATDNDGKQLGSSFFEVSDYVAPTFFITSEHSDEDVNPGDTVKIRGQVLTYSGMPLADAEVKFSVSYTPPMRWFVYSMGTYDSSVTTDSEGRYEISLPTENLKGTQFERGLYTVRLSAVSPAGESQKGPVERFALCQDYNIYSPDGGKKFEISNGIPDITFKVNDMLGRNVKKELNYSLVDKASGKTVVNGSFNSPILTLPPKDYGSGAYNLKVSLSEDPDVTNDLYIVFWRKSDTIAPSGVKLWIPETDITVAKGQQSVNVTVGSGVPDRWIPAVISVDDNLMDVEWIHIVKDNVSIPVKAPVGNNHNSINLCFLSDLCLERGYIIINSAEYADRLKLQTESFRDKISAGDKEHWSFRFSKKYGSVGNLPALAVMTDAALNAITPFIWNFSPSVTSQRSLFSINAYGVSKGSMSFTLNSSKYLRYKDIFYPDLKNYGQGWGIGNYIIDTVKNEVMLFSTSEAGSANVASRSMKKSNMAMAAAPVVARGDVADMAMDDSVAETEAEAEEESPMVTGNDAAQKEEEQLRPAECPVAFFKPFLTSDSEGVVNIDFTVPDFNTTWALQVIGYDESLQTSKIALEAVASKPIMVSTHSPRFVRTGDVVQLTATVFNNTGTLCSPDCRIELVDLISGKTVAAEIFAKEEIAAGGNRLLTLSWTVPSDLSSVGFRTFAEIDGHRDGEQALLPVLPSSSPVVESTPFWFAPEQKEMEIKLPKFNSSDRITLQYCDNPTWYCLTALPDIVNPDSKSVTAVMRALFGNAVAYHLISTNTNLKNGLSTLLSDSNSQYAALKSNLEKDGNIKIVELSNTPWVNNAESETLRMSRLSSLLDDNLAKTTINDMLKEVKALQASDGGWSWCPEMKSSSFITREVLRHFSMISKADALSECNGADSMIKSGIKYVDSETVKDYKKYHKKGESLSYLLDWLFIRSNFDSKLIPNGVSSNEMSSIAAKAVKDIAAEWKDMGIGSKAMAAIVLWRFGNHKVASEIVESLRQFASETPEKGMWFDNLSFGWGSMTTLRTTTLVLEAISEIQPNNKDIDALRQWLILGRQYQDWGKNVSTVETVNAILTSGSDWTANSSSKLPEFYLKGKKLTIPESAALTGAFTMNLNGEDASKKSMKITRYGISPSWGGVVSQYESPILEVKPSEVPELSIRKSIVALVPGENGELVAKENIVLEKGMKVRVTLFITVGRDMDYVAVTDERSACLEPIDQLSGYTSSDGKFFYREVRNAATNLFFEWLPKGHHVISYDCTVSQEGEFSCGIATIQSQYSPITVAHSAGSILRVK